MLLQNTTIFTSMVTTTINISNTYLCTEKDTFISSGLIMKQFIYSMQS